jgi:hypothetical protein
MPTLKLKCHKCDESIELEGRHSDNNAAAYIIGWRLWTPPGKEPRHLCPSHAEQLHKAWLKKREANRT